MNTSISLQHWPDFSACERLFALIAAAGGEARFVGGCVRDALLDRAIGDRDMASTLPPEAMMAALQDAGIRVIPTGLQHGTVTAVISGIPYEITTLREDVETDGRHAVVRFTDDWQADASRRDFTMNALSCGLDGVVQDYFGGVEDARSGHLRFIGDPVQRIEEDALRILRFFRFFAHYGTLPYDAESLEACGKLAKSIVRLSGERIRVEMLKLLAAPTAAEVVQVMEEFGVLAQVGLQARHLDALAALDDPLLKLAALLHGQSSAALADRWRLSNAERDKLAHLVSLDPQAWAEADEAAQKKHLRKDGISLFTAKTRLAAALLQADLSGHLHLAEHWQIPVFPLNGVMLQERGFTQGKALGEALKKLEAQWEAEAYAPTADDLLKKL